MEIDPKCFFENPPRMKEDLKDHMKKLSEKIVTKISGLDNGVSLNLAHTKDVSI